MQHSSPSVSHSTPVPIKVKHRLAKTKRIRRRRIDLECGCSYYLHLNCANNGFTHRGVHHCSSSREWRVYLGDKQSPIFHDHGAERAAIQHQPRHHHPPDPVQPQPPEGTGSSQVLSELPSLDDFTDSVWDFLQSI
uniref:Transcriptional activator protein n=1 Tax=Jatropha mosaic Nigeria virus TaxID=1213406 RepID=I7BFC2_9GEMI|nr:C2 [Jatropha mosaic Nigeria virus]